MTTALDSWTNDGHTMSIARGALATCGCGKHDTAVRVNGEPWHWGCFERAGFPAPTPVGDSERTGLRLLADLKTKAYAPRARDRDGHMRDPFWMPAPAGPIDLVQYPPFAYRRDYAGEVVRLDRTADGISALATVTVAHGALLDAGEVYFGGDPGFYKVEFHEWTEEGTPNPLGPAAGIGRRDGRVWVPHTRVKLLADLVNQGRWPDLGKMPAWTCPDAVRLDRWATHLKTLRVKAIDAHGYGSPVFEEIKDSISIAVSLMIGNRPANERARKWKCDVHRTDWAFTVRDLSACTMWRWFDELRRLAVHHDRPELAPVAIQGNDELVIPANALDWVTSTPRLPSRDGGPALRPLRLDPTGRELGTFKVKP